MNKFLYILSFIILLSCEKREKVISESQGKTEWIDPNKIQQGPVIHHSLTSAQTKNIDYLYNTFKEVDPTSKEKWIEDFKRDQNPDREIEIWMMMANAYNSYCEGKDIKIEVKKEVFQIVLMRSSAPENEVLNQLKLNYISEMEAKLIMNAYTLDAKPIRVIKE
jgi:hypothetical protein